MTTPNEGFSKSAFATASGERGSALVGVIVLSMIMSVVGIAYLHIAMTSAFTTEDSIKESQSFWAAESGRLLGGAWWGADAGPSPVSGATTTLTFGDLSVRDSIGAITGPSGDTAEVLSKVHDTNLRLLRITSCMVVRRISPMLDSSWGFRDSLL